MILNNKNIEQELLFSISLKSNKLDNSFMSIGTILEPRKIVKYLNIYNFIQIKNYMFILVVFKKQKYYKKHSKEVITHRLKRWLDGCEQSQRLPLSSISS